MRYVIFQYVVKIFFIHFKFIKLFYNVFKLREIATEIKYRKGDEIK